MVYAHCLSREFKIRRLKQKQETNRVVSRLQKYSTYPPTIFTALHFANTSLIPLATQSVPDSESYLLLTRELYQAPGLEHLFLTVPVVTHVVAGLGLRNLRASRRARLYGAETRLQRYKVQLWPRMSLQARLGYVLVPLLGAHVLINRVTPLLVDGDSSAIGLGYIAHGFARSPLTSNLYYSVFVAAGVWHIVGGWASWMGWPVTTVRGQWRRRRNHSSLEGHLNEKAWSEQRSQRRNKSKWIVYGVATAGTVFWLAGSLGIVGRGGAGTAWEAKNWNQIYSQVPLISKWL